METTVSTIVAFLRSIKELLGCFGALGEVLAFYFRFPSKYAIPIGLVGSLFIAIWGSFELENGSSLRRTFAWVGLAVGAIGVILFVAVGSIILLRDSSSQGKVTVQEENGFQLYSSKATNKLTGEYPIEIQHEATLVEIEIVPAPEDLAKVQDIDVLTAGPLEQTNKMTLVINKTSNTQTYYQVTSPTKDFNVRLSVTVELKEASAAPKIGMRVFYTYIVHDWLWEARSWIFRKLDW
jgi:hypothetical protein